MRWVPPHPLTRREGPLNLRKSVYEPIGAHQAGGYPGLRSMKRLGVLLLPPGWDVSPSQGSPSSKFASTHLYTWVERGTMRVKNLAQEHNAVPRPGLEPGPPDPESSTLTISPPRLRLNLRRRVKMTLRM